jgi:hypothetical protein
MWQEDKPNGVNNNSLWQEDKPNDVNNDSLWQEDKPNDVNNNSLCQEDKPNDVNNNSLWQEDKPNDLSKIRSRLAFISICLTTCKLNTLLLITTIPFLLACANPIYTIFTK